MGVYKQDYARLCAIKAENKKRILEICSAADEGSGIYVFERIDENGIHYAYIGQAKHLLSRLADHLAGYNQHIDLSIRKHGLFSLNNMGGWSVSVVEHCPVDKLDDEERYHIKRFASYGVQLYNKTIGGQDGGKSATTETVRKGYNEGVRYGQEKAYRDIAHILNTHCKPIEPQKAGNKVQEKAIRKLYWLLGIQEEETNP